MVLEKKNIVKTFKETNFCFTNHTGEQFNQKGLRNRALTKGVRQLTAVTP